MEVHQGPRPPRDQPEWFTGDLWIDAIAQTHGHSRLSTGSVPSSARVPGRAALTSAFCTAQPIEPVALTRRRP
jgi:hypothetical protein